jgi:hypothetical protein
VRTVVGEGVGTGVVLPPPPDDEEDDGLRRIVGAANDDDNTGDDDIENEDDDPNGGAVEGEDGGSDDDTRLDILGVVAGVGTCFNEDACLTKSCGIIGEWGNPPDNTVRNVGCRACHADISPLLLLLLLPWGSPLNDEEEEVDEDNDDIALDDVIPRWPTRTLYGRLIPISDVVVTLVVLSLPWVDSTLE